MENNKKIELYYCKVCGWVGTTTYLVAGALWDYTNYDMCPQCYEKEELHEVDQLYEIYQWHFVADVARKTNKEVTVSADAIISLDDEIKKLERFINANHNSGTEAQN